MPNILNKNLHKIKRTGVLRVREARFPFSGYMNKYKCIFIHIPKTGGTSIRTALGLPKTGRAHIPWYIYYQANPEKFDNYFKFSFIRDPIERTYSAYKYLHQGGNLKKDQNISEEIRSYLSFSNFVKHGLKNGFFLHHILFIPQSHFICDHSGHVKVNFLGQTDNLDIDASLVLKYLGVKRKLRHCNMSSHDNLYEKAIEPETVDILRDIYRTDFLLLEMVKNHAF